MPRARATTLWVKSPLSGVGSICKFCFTPSTRLLIARISWVRLSSEMKSTSTLLIDEIDLLSLRQVVLNPNQFGNTEILQLSLY